METENKIWLASAHVIQNRSFHDVVRMRTAAKCKNETCMCSVQIKLLLFIVKCANL